MKWTLGILGIAFFMTIAGAEARGRQGPAASPAQISELQEQLGLSDVQQKEIGRLRTVVAEKIQKNQLQVQDAQDQMRQARLNLQNLMRSQADDDELHAAFKKIQEAQAQMHSQRLALEALRFENALKIRKVLTPEQRLKFANLSETNFGQGGMGFGQGMGRGGQGKGMGQRGGRGMGRGLGQGSGPCSTGGVCPFQNGTNNTSDQ